MAKSDAQRSRAYRDRRGIPEKPPLKPCGTVAAAKRHYRAGGTPELKDCPDCYQAWQKHQTAMSEQRTAKRRAAKAEAEAAEPMPEQREETPE